MGTEVLQNKILFFLNEENKKILYEVGVIFFAISVVPSIVTLATNIYLTFTVGYSERMLNSMYRRSGITNLLSIISRFMTPSLLAMYIGKCEKQKWPTIAIVIYILLYSFFRK